MKKRLIVCCDGTWNRADQAKDGKPCPTNVVKTAYRAAKRDHADASVPQVTYYSQGVGTGNSVDRYTGGAFGHGLDDNLFDAYRFLVANYEPGDDVFLFGFSRGAFTARSLGGMVRNCGILKRTSVDKYPEALDLYRDREHAPDDETARRFRGEHSILEDENVPIRFIGVWDTVGALGIPVRGLRSLTRGKYQFHDVQLSSTVAEACHALAVDERRAPFEPSLWFQKPEHREAGQKVEQRWFCGVHSDVGGGYAETHHSDLALEWMLGKARGAGLSLDDSVLRKFVLHGDSLKDPHDSKKGLYRVTPGLDRPIGLGPKDPKDSEGEQQEDPTQTVDDSVLRRWDEIPKYRPPQLRDYFRRHGDPRGR